MALLNSLKQRPVRKGDVASRVCAALLGGYAVSAAGSMLLARVMPLSKAGATTTAMLLTPILYLAAILWSFGARSPSRAWLVLVIVAGACGLLAWGLMSLRGPL